jgi:hypothetical protein
MDGIDPDRNYRPNAVAVLEGVGPTTIFKRLAEGQYEGFKDGQLTLITGRSILERRKQHLKPAQYNMRKGMRGVPRTADDQARS